MTILRTIPYPHRGRRGKAVGWTWRTTIVRSATGWHLFLLRRAFVASSYLALQWGRNMSTIHSNISGRASEEERQRAKAREGQREAERQRDKEREVPVAIYTWSFSLFISENTALNARRDETEPSKATIHRFPAIGAPRCKQFIWSILFISASWDSCSFGILQERLIQQLH